METEANKLVERTREGSEEAAARLIELHYARIYAYLRRLTANESEAADLTQRTFARVWQALSSFAGRSSVSSWIHGIAYHTYVDWMRANHRAEAKSEQWWADRPSNTERPDQTVARTDIAQAVYAFVDRLDPDLRDAVHLHYYQGLTLQETAEAMAVAASTVKYRLRQALEELQKAFASDGLCGGAGSLAGARRAVPSRLG
jgi:RNA polymerase sigma-70 factor (ECF subfamily)